jgi:hypothetical protein
MVVVALGLGWWVDHRLLSLWGHRASDLDMELRARGWVVVFTEDGGLILEPPPNPAAPAKNLPSD